MVKFKVSYTKGEFCSKMNQLSELRVTGFFFRLDLLRLQLKSVRLLRVDVM